jgi:predicted RNA binding protein YcfA (HicA-like mRNA interferase family)
MAKVREVIRHLEREGWTQVRMRGSHRVYKHPSRPLHVTVPGYPNDDVPPGTLNDIRTKAGWKESERQAP